MSAPSALNLLEFVFPKRVPIILQSEATECGLACLAMIASYHGLKTDLNGMRQRVSISLTGTTLKSIMAAAGAMDLACRPLRLELEAIGSIRRPAILHWDMNHFVVLTKVSREKVRINDPHIIRYLSMRYTALVVSLSRSAWSQQPSL
jgi:ATP-binding cassette, subfamily B, bacterial CvaB/MchF/RaxB